MEEKKKSGLATAGLVLGIIGIVLSFIPIVNNAAFFLGALALIFGAICLAKKKSIGKSVAALVLGILAVVITLSMQSAAAKAIDEISEEISSGNFSAATAAGVTAPASSEQTFYTVGDTAEISGSKITLTDAKLSQGDGLFAPESGKMYLTLDFDIENASNDDLSVSSLLSFHAYCDDYECGISIGASGSDTIDGRVAPGKKIAGSLGYEVPEDFRSFEVRYSSSLLSSKYVTFVVKGAE